jgi:hypothetical protein
LKCLKLQKLAAYRTLTRTNKIEKKKHSNMRSVWE